MFIEREEDGVWLRDLPIWVVDTLLCLPEWIESDSEDVQARLLPRAYEDDELDKEWRDALGSTLEHLFAKRTEIVGFDLVEVNPQLDVGTGMTSYLAAHTILEFLGRICDQPRWIAKREGQTT